MVDQHQQNVNKIPSTVFKLGWVSFFADVASEMLYPITPIFLTTVLGASMTSLGAIEGIAEAIASLLKTYSGSWSDAVSKRKPLIIAGYFLGAISKPAIGISQTWTHVLLAKCIDRTGKGIRSAPRDALLSDSVPPQHLGAAFGWHRGMDSLGAALGPLIAIALLSVYSENLRIIYYYSFIPGLLSVGILFFIQEQTKKSKSKPWVNPLQSWSHFNKPLKSYLWTWGIFSLTNSSDVFLLMKAKSSGVSTTMMILMYCFYNLIYSIMSPPLGKLSDGWSRRKLMCCGLGIFILVYLGFGFASQAWHYWVLFPVYGLYIAATDGVGKALALDFAPQEMKATTVGALGTITGICTVIASLIAGLVWDHFGATWTFIYGTVGAALALLMMLNLKDQKSGLNF